jgi:hypothetical protein|tara:strand:+ start:4963 stop:5709 length:747 start_codon:yes stop_codon:yes gene_type:complete
MRGLPDRFVMVYGTPHRSLMWGFIGYCTLMTGLQVSPSTFGVVLILAALAVSWRASGNSISERTPAVSLLLLVALSGLVNDFRLVGVVTAAAFVSTPVIAAIGNKRKNLVFGHALRVMVAWLPASLTAASLTVLAFRDSSCAGLLLSLVFVHDLGLGLGMRDRSRRHLAPFFGIIGALAILWTSIQISASPISPRWFWPFALLVVVAIPLGRIVMGLVSTDDDRDLKRFSSYFLVTPLWVLANNVLFI